MYEIVPTNYGGTICQTLYINGLWSGDYSTRQKAEEAYCKAVAIARTGQDLWQMEQNGDLVEDADCSECGDTTASDEGLCYRCQCREHASGSFDMDRTINTIFSTIFAMTLASLTIYGFLVLVHIAF